MNFKEKFKGKIQLIGRKGIIDALKPLNISKSILTSQPPTTNDSTQNICHPGRNKLFISRQYISNNVNISTPFGERHFSQNHNSISPDHSLINDRLLVPLSGNIKYSYKIIKPSLHNKRTNTIDFNESASINKSRCISLLYSKAERRPTIAIDTGDTKQTNRMIKEKVLSKISKKLCILNRNQQGFPSPYNDRSLKLPFLNRRTKHSRLESIIYYRK
jgi:hypothetical protein